MIKYHLIIDGGTTNTRFTLLEGEKVITRTIRRSGAADADAACGNSLLKHVIREELCSLQDQYGCITDIFASGMITSNAGLYEVPHIPAPASLKDLAAGVRTTVISDISRDIKFHFVPGLRFINQIEYGADMMRGEETEIMGAIEDELVNKSLLFLHCGSHNKLIRYYDGKIRESVTTIGGELLWAVLNDTILKSSAAELSEAVPLDREYVKRGYHEAVKYGLSRALFLARICHVIEDADKNQVLSFIYGAIASSDLQVLGKFIGKRCDKIILYGREGFLRAFEICLPLSGTVKITPDRVSTISREDSELLSVKGIGKIRDIFLNKLGGKEDKENGGT